MAIKIRLECVSKEELETAIAVIEATMGDSVRLGKPKTGTDPKIPGFARWRSYGDLTIKPARIDDSIAPPF
jgi:hypothetical protein